MLNDPLAAALTKIVNAERVGKTEVVIANASKIIKKVLELLNEQHYLGTFEEFDSEKGPALRVHLLGNINKAGAIKPRFSTKHLDYAKWEQRYLPATDFGVILISTSQGILTHRDAKGRGIGGKLLAYCY